MFVTAIDEEFVRQYKKKTPPWSGIGYVVYKRTYARKIEGEDRTEEWYETVRRCCNGLIAIGGKFTKEEIETLYDKVFNFKCCFSGRALWQLGTNTVKKLGGDSLVNCWVVPINEPIKPFCFAFNELMLGGGVGFNIQAEYVYEIPKVKFDVQIIRRDEKDVDFIVPDNREGWVDLLRKVLNAFFYTGKGFTYSTICVRGKGSAIHTFGGVASGPEDLCRGIDQIIGVLRARVGEKLRPIDCLDIMNIIGSVVVAGNVRRSAMLALGDSNDSKYLDAKNWSKGTIPNWRAMSNNSIVCNKIEDLSDKFWSGYNGDGEPYGLVNIKNCRMYGRLADGKDYRPDKKVVATNPCIAAGSLVYVADGRGSIPIEQLVKEGRDVPVFCLDNYENVVVRTMRHPRKTGVKQAIIKITLENGHVLRVTRNHKFLTSEGKYVQSKDLKVGDGLRTLCRFEATMSDVLGPRFTKGQDYWWTRFGTNTRAEHRIIVEESLGRKLLKDEVVHHRDYNGKNNAIGNLAPMGALEHNTLHRIDKLGDKNPMARAKREWTAEKWDQYKKNLSNAVSAEKNARYCGQTNEDLKNYALELTKSLGRRFSNDEWIAYAKIKNLPQHFSKWRSNHLGGIAGLSTWAALELGFDKEIDQTLDSRTLRLYKKMASDGYNVFVKDKQIFVEKKCELCGTSFSVSVYRREVAYCSRSCANINTWTKEECRKNRKAGAERSIKNHLDSVRTAQLAIYTKLKKDLGRIPDKKEWQQACKKDGVSFEISRKTSPFRFWKELKKQAEAFNHRIVSIETDAREDVYNGTVDEFHNFFVGGFTEKTKNDKHKSIWYNNLQCGEVPLPPYSACNLFEIFLPNIKDEEEFKTVAALGIKVTKTISCLNFIHEETNDIVHDEFRLGNGITGILQASPELRNDKVLDRVYKHMEKTDKEYSKLLGVKPSIKLTTVKPSGTLSLMPNVTAGIHPAFAPYYIRRVRMASSDSIIEVCRKSGYYVEPAQNFDGTSNWDTMVVSFPVKVPVGTICAKDLTAVQQMEWAKWAQAHWADNSVSVTIYYKKEELPQIKKWLEENYDKSVKSMSFCLHSEHGFKQPPYEEITEEQYKQMIKNVKPITKIEEKEFQTLIDNLECSGGACPIK